VVSLDAPPQADVALDAMTRTAQATRDRAAALDMKAKALSGAKTTDEDPNKYGDQVPGGKNASASLFVDHITNIDD
jgi:hypothetical protein